MSESLQYPIGKFKPSAAYSDNDIANYILTIEKFPEKLEQLYARFTPSLLEKPYRPGGWTARQLIHHLADSHMNAYIRCKWTITEATPLIKAYNEKDWAETTDISLDPILSVKLLKALHQKWVGLLRSLSIQQLNRSFTHPETNKNVRMGNLIALYAWHGEHHLAHLRLILD